ncbi:hypothetical protein G6F46_015375 [Rhizopus delemar]|nr:hypothetical protein G6F46_015375 [Rhizopus delemar]
MSATATASLACGACPRWRTSRSRAKAWSSFSTRISASGRVPPADSRRSSATPNRRCSGFCRTSTLWMRANGISRRLRASRPLRTVIASLPMR